LTRTITCGLARIDTALDDCVYMGNLDSLRHWGHARDYVEMPWRMLQQEGHPQDFVIATGRKETVHRFIQLDAEQLGWGSIEWEGDGIGEIGRRSSSTELVVRFDHRYIRPAEVETPDGDPTKAHAKLGCPTTTLEQLVAELVAVGQDAVLRRKFLSFVGSMEDPPNNPPLFIHPRTAS